MASAGGISIESARIVQDGDGAAAAAAAVAAASRIGSEGPHGTADGTFGGADHVRESNTGQAGTDGDIDDSRTVSDEPIILDGTSFDHARSSITTETRESLETTLTSAPPDPLDQLEQLYPDIKKLSKLLKSRKKVEKKVTFDEFQTEDNITSKLIKDFNTFWEKHEITPDDKEIAMKVIRYMNYRKKDISCPEIKLALCERPLNDVHNIAIFTPNTTLENNGVLTTLIEEAMEDLGIDEQSRDNAILFIRKRFKHNLNKIRKEKEEIPIDAEIKVTLDHLDKEVGKVNEEGNTPEMIKAEILFNSVQGLKMSKKKATKLIDAIEVRDSIPGACFEKERKSVTKALIVLLHRLGVIDLNKITSQEIVKIMDRFTKSNDQALRFLDNGEKSFEEMQRKFLDKSSELIILDKLDLLEQLKNFNLFELLRFGRENTHKIDWRVQANNLAYIRYRLMWIDLNIHCIQARPSSVRLRDVMTDTYVEQKDRIWQSGKTGDPSSTDKAIYSNRHADKTTERSDDSEFLEGIGCRKWTSPLSGRKYEIRLVDGLIKDPFSILLKEILKNSDGNPEHLYDLVRQTIVFSNVIDLNDDVTRKDIYYLLNILGGRYGLIPALKDETQSEIWDNTTSEQVLNNFLSRDEMKEKRKAEKKLGGYFTLEDKGINGTTNERSEQTDIKLVARDLEGVGIEIQALIFPQFTDGRSTNTSESHSNYKLRSVLDVMVTLYPPHLFPDTYQTIVQIKLGMKQKEITNKINRIEKALEAWLTPIELTEEQSALVNNRIIMELQQYKEELKILHESVSQEKIKAKERGKAIKQFILGEQTTTSRHIAVSRSA